VVMKCEIVTLLPFSEFRITNHRISLTAKLISLFSLVKFQQIIIFPSL